MVGYFILSHPVYKLATTEDAIVRQLSYYKHNILVHMVCLTILNELPKNLHYA